MKNLRKRQTLIDVFTNVKTQEGNQLRVFVQVISQRYSKQVKLNSYLEESKVKEIRKRVTEFLIERAAKSTSDAFVKTILFNEIDKPLADCYRKIAPHTVMQITKVKLIKKESYDEIKPSDYTQKIEEAKVEAQN